MRYSLERAGQSLFEEIAPLLRLHFEEIAHFRDIELSPDYERYQRLEDSGALRIYTVRLESSKLIGYAVFLVSPNLHYKESLQAAQDVLFVHPHYRGQGGKFILWCDKQLEKEGVQLVTQHIKAAHDFGAMLMRLGYEKIDIIYGKRLDRVRVDVPRETIQEVSR